MADVQIRRISGADIHPYLERLARLRIEIFRAFPYLYEGSMDYEEAYLRTYSAHPESLFVVAFDGDEVVGVSTGVPMTGAEEAFRQPFVQAGYDPEAVFYFGESVLRASHRGHGIGHRFFDEREAYARRKGRFRYAAFCAVERPPDHPRRPSGYTPLDAFWERRGFTKHPELKAFYRWQDVGEAAETAKPMVFWIKPLRSTD